MAPSESQKEAAVNLAQLLANPPVLHVDQAGRATSWKVSDRLLTSLDGLLHEEDRTLETGQASAPCSSQFAPATTRLSCPPRT